MIPNQFTSRCQNRYTHANRHCPIHPYIKPQRSTDLVMQPTLTSDENCNREIAKWLEKYRNERQDKTTTTPAKDPGLPSLAEHHHNEYFITPIKKSKTKRGLTEELEQQENSPMKRKKFAQQQNGIHQLQFTATQQQQPQPTAQLMFHNQPLSLFPSFAVAAAATTSASSTGLEAPPKSPMKNLPALALLNSRSLLEERLKISPPRKAQQAALADITASTNEGPSPITTATSTLAGANQNAGVHRDDPEAQARSALSVLLAAAANRFGHFTQFHRLASYIKCVLCNLLSFCELYLTVK